jgi:hypothetical protein
MIWGRIALMIFGRKKKMILLLWPIDCAAPGDIHTVRVVLKHEKQQKCAPSMRISGMRQNIYLDKPVKITNAFCRFVSLRRLKSLACLPSCLPA